MLVVGRSLGGNRRTDRYRMATPFLCSTMHVGKLIEQQFRAQGHTVTWFANQLCCTRANVYKIFSKENVDVHLLVRISRVLHYDFFLELSREGFKGVNKCDTIVSINS